MGKTMRVFTGAETENPCEKCKFRKDCIKHELTCVEEGVYKGQQSILNQCVEIPPDWRPEDIDKIRNELNPHDNFGYTNRDYGERRVWADGFEAGFSACLEALGRV